MARRRTLITYLTAYVFAMATVLRGLIQYRGLPVFSRVAGLSAAFVLLLVIEPWFTRRSRWYAHLYLALQTGIVSILLLTRPYEDFKAVLFVSLSLQAMHVFLPRTGYRWTTVFTVAIAATLIYTLGWREGLPRFLMYPAACFASGLLIVVTRQAEDARAQAERARIESQELLAELQAAHQRLQVYAAQAALINRVGQRVSGELELDALLSEIVTAVHDAFDYHNVGLFLLPADGTSADDSSAGEAPAKAERLTLTSIAGDHADLFAEGFSIAITEGMTGHAAMTGEIQVSSNVSEDPHYVRVAEEETRSEMAVPIVSGQKIIGVLDIQRGQLGAFHESDRVAMETLSTQIAAAIENARLYEAAQRELAERVQAEERLREAKEGAEEARAAAEKARMAAEDANRAKSVFLANMSHELRTPLNAILGFSQLMTRDPELTPEQRDNLETIGRSGEHLLGLINDVLELSKIEAGRAALNEGSFDLHRLLDGLEEMFRLRATGKGLMLIFERAPSLPQYVRTDEGKLRQVLMNVLGNAVKYTQEGGITLRAGCPAAHGEAPSNGQELRLLIEVEDTGPGIAPEEIDAVFDPFKQTSTGLKSREGTGLGMPISRQFVRLMGGDLTFSSELGTGTLFGFDVPIELADAADVPTSRPRQRVVRLDLDGGPAGGGPYRLLVAEDREASRKLLVRLLAPLGFEIREATNGQEAIEMWERWKPHLIWMDVRMPALDGQEATRRIKATAQGHDTVIVALTASAFEEDRAAIMSAGCDDFVRKPFREQEILDMLTKHLGVRFVYEGAAEEGQGTKGVLTPAALVALPGDWVAELSQAAMQADASLVLDLLDQIREQHAWLADALADLVDDFRFDRIVALTREKNAQESR